MSSHKRRKVASSSTAVYRLPQLKTEARSTTGSSPSTRDVLNKEEFVNLLKQAFEEKMAQIITPSLKNNKTKEKIQDLKSNEIRRKRIPIGTYNKINDRFNSARFTASTIKKYKIDPLVISVAEKFDSVVSQIQNKTGQSSSTVAIDMKKAEEPLIRACVTPFDSLLREDLPEALKNYLLEGMRLVQEYVTDYVMDFSLAIHSSMLIYVGADSTTLRNSISINELIPLQFQDPASNKSIIATLGFDGQNEVDQKNLFSLSHLQYINSSNFGARGSLTGTVKHPLWTSIQQKVSKNAALVSQFNSTKGLLASPPKANAMSQFSTNLENMWADAKIFKRSLNNLIRFMLALHLAPQSEIKKRQETEANKEKSVRAKETAIPIPITRNRRRTLIRQEYKKLQKYSNRPQTEALQAKFQQCQARIQFFKLLKNKKADVMQEGADKEDKNIDSQGEEDVGKEDEEIDPEDEENDLDNLDEGMNQEASKVRLRKIAGILKKSLYSNKEVKLSVRKLKTYSDDLSNKETTVILLLYNFIKPYMPAKEKYYFIGFQLPLVIMANQVLTITGFKKYAQYICPSPRASKVLSLKLDSSTLYSILALGSTKYVCLKSNDEIITSIADATWNKNYIFGSVFNLNKIQAICNSRHLEFIYYMTVRPKAKTCALLGELHRKDAFLNRQRMLESAAASEMQLKPLEPREKLLQEKQLKADSLQLKEVNDKLVQFKKNFNLYQQDKHIRGLKSKWHNIIDNEMKRRELYLEIEEAKQERSRRFEKMEKMRQKLIYLRRKCYLTRQSIERLPSKKQREKAGPSIEPVNVSSNTSKLSTYSGTDYGLHTMSVSVPISTEKYNFHISLFNYFNPLQKISEVDDYKPGQIMQKQDLIVPPTFEINSSDLNNKSLAFKHQKSLERRKKKTNIGQLVTIKEQELSKNGETIDRTSLTDIIGCHQLHQGAKSVMRQFYASKRAIKNLRSQELQTKKLYDRICSAERRFLSNGHKTTQLGMYIGNQGTGIGSTIKGFSRRGGKWHSIIHSRYSTVAMTNEYRTSQTCMFCFGQVVRPIDNSKKVNGSSRCINANCPAVKLGVATQGRDKMAAFCIGLSGITEFLFNKALPPFSAKGLSVVPN